MRLKQFVVFALAAFLSCAGWAQTAPEPVNPHATPEARALLAYLDSISGKLNLRFVKDVLEIMWSLAW